MLGSVEPFVVVISIPLGGFLTAYTMVVPDQGELPRPSWSMMTEVRSWSLVSAGALTLTGLSTALSLVLESAWLFAALWLPGMLAGALAIIDVRVRRLPFAISGVIYTVSGAVLLLEAVDSGDMMPLARASAGCAAVVGVSLLLALLLPGQLGLGDVVVLGWIAMTLAWLGWAQLGTGLIAGVGMQAIVACAVMAARRRIPVEPLPMGPALIAGWLVGVVGAGS